MILTHDWDGEVKGLKEWAPEDRPNATLLFWSFRIMVGIGIAMMALGIWSLWLRIRGRLYDAPVTYMMAVFMGPSGFIAVLSGWITTEVGRQPYTVYGVLRTIDSASPLDAPAVAISLAVFAVVYFIVFGAGLFYILRLMASPPHSGEDGLQKGIPMRAAGGIAIHADQTYSAPAEYREGDVT